MLSSIFAIKTTRMGSGVINPHIMMQHPILGCSSTHVELTHKGINVQRKMILLIDY